MDKLTREEILAMTGKPEDVDRVAELMGWHTGGDFWLDSHNDIAEHIYEWTPFKSWDDVKDVVDRMRERHVFSLMDSLSDTYLCKFSAKGRIDYRPAIAIADNVPTAICRAALLTVLEV